MRKGNHKAQQIPKKSKEAFLQERNTRGNKFEGLTVLQENVISYIHSGLSMSYIARQIYNVHPNTLSSAVNSVRFVQVLDEVNQAEQVVSMSMIVNKLAEIISTSTNESNIIKACQALSNILPSITQKELYDCLLQNNISADEARELLNSLSPEDIEEVEEDEEESN